MEKIGACGGMSYLHLCARLNPEARDVLPGMALTGFKTRYEPPLLSEGFQDLTEMAFKVLTYA